MLPFAATLLAVSACSGPVEVDAVTPQAGTASLCDDLKASLPAVVDDQPLRKVKPASAGSAWGDPAIVLRCGVAKPVSLTPTSQCFPVSGVDWLSEETARRFVFTTVGRKANIQVSVPREYDPASDALADLAEAVRTRIPSIRACV